MRTNTQSKFLGTLNGGGAGRFRGSLALFSSALLLSLSMMSGKVAAQITLAQHSSAGCGGTCTTITPATDVTATSLLVTGLGTNGACGTGGKSGLTNNGVTTYSPSNGRVYFDLAPAACHSMTVTGFTAKLRRSNAGLRKVRFAYSTNGGSTWTTDLTDKAPQNTSCGGGSTVFTWNGVLSSPVNDGETIRFALFPFDPQSAGGVIQFNDISIIGTVDAVGGSCTGTPDVATVTGGTTVCGGVAPGTLSASGYSTGCGITYQWQSDCGSGYADITGATNTTYTVPTSTPSTPESCNYRMVTTCASSMLSSNSSSATVVVNPVATVDPITVDAGDVTPSLHAGLTATFGNTTAGGVWTNSPTTVGTIDFSTGDFTAASASGSTTVTYTVSNMYGCDNFATLSFDVLNTYPEGTLFDYVGTTGSNTNTIAYSDDETVSNLSQADFAGTGTPCGSGGLSGLQVNTAVATYDATSGPRVYVSVTPDAGKAISLYKFGGTFRRSGTGTDSTRLAYSLDNGATWIPQSATTSTYLPSGDCGATTYTRIWELSAPVRSTANILVAVFPHHPGSSTGTFQVNRFFADGQIISSTPCSVTPDAGTITPDLTVGCGDGYFDGTFVGTDSVGYTYQWQNDTAGSFQNIAGENSVYYTSQNYTTVPTTVHYQMVRTCAFGGSNSVSTTATLNVISALSITSVSGSITPLAVGSMATLTPSLGGGTWSSFAEEVATIGSASGEVTGQITGTATLRYSTPGFGCFVDTTIDVMRSGYLSIYFGEDGTSTTVSPVLAGHTAGALAPSGTYTVSGTCGSGGYSGFKIDPAITSYSTSGPNISYLFTVNAGKDVRVDDAFATTRASGSGAQNYRLAYQIDGGAWIESDELYSNVADCGESIEEPNHGTVPFGAGTSVRVGVFPYNAALTSGTFQLNSLSLIGVECDQNGAIEVDDASGIHGLAGNTYNPACGPFTITTTGDAGGTWSSSDPSVADATGSGLSGTLTLGTDGTATIIYTNSCLVQTTANVTVSSSSAPTCDGAPKPGAPAVSEAAVTDVTIYPNPTNGVLNVKAGEKVNVTVLSMDGRMLMSKQDATSVNVSKLASGAYMIQVSNENGKLIKTAKFTKQ